MIATLRSIALDSSAPDRIPAIASLARLGAAFDESGTRMLRELAKGAAAPVRAAALSALTKTDEASRATDTEALVALLATAPSASNIAAAALRELGELDTRSLDALGQAFREDQSRVETLGVLAVHDRRDVGRYAPGNTRRASQGR